MIEIDEIRTFGWEPAIRGMRNPMNSWDRSDTEHICPDEDTDRWCGKAQIGPADHELMMKLAKNGSVHAKYRRMITVYMDITAPLYWWKEFDTYKVGTVANSCSTMHKIQEKEFTLEDFSQEHLIDYRSYAENEVEIPYINLRGTIIHVGGLQLLQLIVDTLNFYCERYNLANERLNTDHALTDSERKHLLAQRKRYWWQTIQLLPSSYNQKRTVMMNYEVLSNIYASRKNHKLDEWRDFCSEIEKLPYSELITLADPCETCAFYPPSSCGGKPCSQCNPDDPYTNCHEEKSDG